MNQSHSTQFTYYDNSTHLFCFYFISSNIPIEYKYNVSPNDIVDTASWNPDQISHMQQPQSIFRILHVVYGWVNTKWMLDIRNTLDARKPENCTILGIGLNANASIFVKCMSNTILCVCWLKKLLDLLWSLLHSLSIVASSNQYIVVVIDCFPTSSLSKLCGHLKIKLVMNSKRMTNMVMK